MGLKYDAEKNAFSDVVSETDSILPQMIWHLTNKCKLKCKMCFSRRTPDPPYDRNKVITTMQLLCKLGVQKIDISGGEPLLFDDLPFIVELCRNSNVSITITTSGVATSEKINWLIQNSQLFSRIIVSLDFPTKNMHDKFRGSGRTSAFDAGVKLCRNLAEADYKYVRVNTLISKSFVKDSVIVAMCKLIKTLNPLEWCIIQPHPVNKKVTYDKYDITSNCYAQVFRGIKEYMGDSTINIISRDNTNYSTYWALQSNFELCRLSEKEEYSVLFDFSEDNLPEVICAINSSRMWVPNVS